MCLPGEELLQERQSVRSKIFSCSDISFKFCTDNVTMIRGLKCILEQEHRRVCLINYLFCV